MADFKGKGSMKGKDLLVVAYDSSLGKGNKGNLNYLDVQLDHRDPAGPGQSNLHLKSQIAKDKETGETLTKPDGGPLRNHNVNYFQSQFDAIKEVAGPNQQPLMSADGSKRTGTVYAINADLMKNPSGPGLMLDSKTVAQSSQQLTPTTIQEQFASMKAAGVANRQAAEAKAKEAPEAAQEQTATFTAGTEGVESTEAQVDEPAFS